MYTLLMSWSFRAFILTVVLAWGLAPQLACFMPEQPLTPAEMDCCNQMANACGGTNMSHACCRAAARTDIGIATKAIGNPMPRFETAGVVADNIGFYVLRCARELWKQSDHAPPDLISLSPLILRI